LCFIVLSRRRPGLNSRPQSIFWCFIASGSKGVGAHKLSLSIWQTVIVNLTNCYCQFDKLLLSIWLECWQFDKLFLTIWRA
jgi:hypothetical protein